MTMNRYESYQDSGIQWLGEVPAHWEIKAIKRVVKEHSGNGFPIELQGNNGEIPFLKVSDLNKKGKFLNDFTNTVDEDLAIMMKWNILPKFSLVTAKIGEALRKNHRKIICNSSIIDNNCIGFECINIDVNYHYYLSLIIDFDWFENGGTVPSLSVQKYKNQKICIPPLPEQTAIADYLDNKLGEIDALISKQETLLAKLAEQRTAIITHAVTKGLNAHAPMKNSGVAWLGNVPEHWEIKHGNQIFKIHNGATPKTSEPNYWGDEITWFTPKDLGDNQNKEISGSLKMITKEGYESCGVSLAPANSIALSKRAPIGHLAITTLPAVVNQGCFLLEVLKANNVNYLYYWLYANKVVLNSFGQGSTFMELPREKFAMLKISIPPLPEQTAIANYLDEQTAKIDRLSDTVNQTIASLKEYRSALITQAVTGKIKVI